MIRGLYTAASAMIARQAQQENLSNNIANVNTPGYKKDSLSFKSFEEYMIQNYDNNVGGKSFPRKLGNLEFGVGVDSTKTYFEQGIIQDTGRDLDFALNGDRRSGSGQRRRRMPGLPSVDRARPGRY
jgi:flagellar basal-body rod protein FlgG